jgi:ribose 5-phosphate isomerase A
LIIDLNFSNGIDQPELLESQINNIPGVLENGLFVNLTDEVLVGKVENGEVGVDSLKKI